MIRSLIKKRKSIIIIFVFIISFVFGINFVQLEKQGDIPTTIIDYTVDNQEYGMPYINPAWEEYMKLSDEEKEQVVTIPQKYITKYVNVEDLYYNYDELPDRYSTRDQYPTTMYDQGSEGLCWAYATTTMLESNLKVTKGIDVNFSQKHIDLLTSNNSLFINKYNPYTLKRSTSDGLFYGSEFAYNNVVLNAGYIPVATDKFILPDETPYNISEIADDDKLEYTITDTVIFPSYVRTSKYSIKDDPYINMLKSFIMKYGGVKFGTYWSTDPSGYNSEYFYTFDKADVIAGGHAMVIVGWDDNYGPNNEGAWIIQNSWSETYGAQMFYYSYELDNDMLNSLVGIKNIDIKDWDNSYNYTDYPKIEYVGLNIPQKYDNNDYNSDSYDESDYGSQSASLIENAKSFNSDAVKGTIISVYNKSSKNTEKLNMINFVSASQNSTYKVYISPDGSDNYNYMKEIKTDMPGLYTIYYKDDNVVLDSDKFSIKIVTEDGALYTQINAFTNDVNKTEDLVDIKINEFGVISDGSYEYDISMYTNSIADGETIKFRLYDSEGNLLKDYIDTDVTLANGKTISRVLLPNTTQLYSKYSIVISHNEEIIDTLELEFNPEVDLKGMNGNGTEEDPYKISNSEQLYAISSLPSAYYELINDIALSFDTNNGYGWIPIEVFSGYLDGNGYAIKNLTINSELLGANVGLFEKLQNATIENLKIENAYINIPTARLANNLGYYSGDDSAVGILAGRSQNSSIYNVYVSGDILSSRKHSGLLVGKVEYNNDINSVMAIGSIRSSDSSYLEYLGGFIGFNDTTSSYDLNVSNIGVVANLYNSNNKGIFAGRGGSYGFNNSYGYVKYNDEVLTETPLANSNNYYIDSEDIFSKFGTDEFMLDSNIWEKDELGLYPSLKNLDIVLVEDISTDNELNVNQGADVQINSTVLPSNASYKNLIYISEDESIATVSVDGVITGISTGSTNIIIKSADGSGISKIVKVNVENSMKVTYSYGDHQVIKYYSDGEIVNLPDGIMVQGENQILYRWRLGKNSSNYFYPNEEYTITDGDIWFYAEYVDDVLQNAIYDYDNYKKTISNIGSVSISDYKNNLNVEDIYTVKVFQNDDEVISGNMEEGMITKVFLADELIISYTNVIFENYTVTYRDGDNIYTEEYEEGESIVFKSDLEKAGYKLVGWTYGNSYYKLTDNLTMPGNDIELVAKWELIIPEIKNYETSESYITGISLNIEVSKINLGIDSIYDVKVYNHDNESKTSGLIGTGDRIKIYLDDTLVSEYEVIIKGDITGDGNSKVNDVAKLYQYLKGKITMDECYISAGNVVNGDDIIKINDVAKLYQFIKGKINNL